MTDHPVFQVVVGTVVGGLILQIVTAAYNRVAVNKGWMTI